MSSKTIDDKVVEMRFDNQQFERNVQTSLSTLEKLKRALRLDGAGNAFEKLEKASGNCNMSGLSRGVETVQAKFSALEVIGMTALANITNSAINTGTQLVKSLSIDQVAAGWGKYGQKTASVQTIMNATGKSIDEVNGYLDKLMWFSDETSYGFTDMTSALGQLTSAGGDIDKLIPMITGIANATAFAGKGAAEFSRSIYNLNQSYSAGSLQYMDWRSLELAGVASEQLKRTFIETGVALGKIKEGQVTIANFGSTLKDKWADTSVMEAAFGKFGEMTEKAYEMVQSGAVETASEAYAILAKEYDGISIKAAKAAQEAKTFGEAIDATKDAVSSGWMKSFELIFGNYEEAKVLWTDLANSLWDVFASGAEARNEMLTGALTSGWSQFLKEGIPDAVEFKQAIVDTALAHGVALNDIIQNSEKFEDSLKEGWLTADTLAESIAALTAKTAGLSDKELANLGYTRSQIDALEELNRSIQDGTLDIEEYANQIGRLSGRENLVQAFWNTWNAFFADSEEQIGILTAFKQAFREIFPATTSEQLYAFTEALRKLTEKFKMSGETADKLKRSCKGLFAILDIMGSFVSAVLNTGFDLLSSALGNANFHILDMTASAGDAVVAFRDWIKEHNVFAGSLGVIANGLKIGTGLIRDWVEQLLSLPKVQERITRLKDSFANAKAEVYDFFAEGLKKFSEFMERVNALDHIGLDNISGVIKDFKENVLSYFVTLGGRFNSFGDVLTALKGKVLECLTGMKGGFNNLGEVVEAMKNHIAGYFTGLTGHLDGTLKKIVDFIANLRSKFSDKIGLGEILTIGIGAGLIVTVKKLGDALELLAGPFAALSDIGGSFAKVLTSCSKALNAFALKTKSQALINIAGAIAILVGAIAVLTMLDQDRLLSAVVLLGGLAAGLVGLAAAMGALEKVGDFKKISFSFTGLAMALLVLVTALKKLESLDGNKVWGNLGILALLTAGLTAAAVVMGKAAPELTKGSIFLLAFASSIRILISSMKSLEKLDLSRSGGSIPILAAMVAGLAVVARSCGNLKIGSAASILAIAVSLGILTSTFQKIASLDLNQAKGAIGAFIAIFASFSGIMAASKLAGANAAKAGVGILAMSAALLLLVPAIKGLGKIDPLDMERATKAISKLLLVFAAVTAASKFAGENAARAGVMLLAMSGALVILSGVMVLLSHIEPDGLGRALGAIIALEVVFGALIAVTKFAGDAKGTLTMIAVTIGLLATALGALSLINPQNLLTATASLSLVMGAFSLVIASTNLAKKATSTIAVMVVAVGALAGILTALSMLQTQNSVANAGALSMLLLALSGAMVIAGKAGTVSANAYAALGMMTLVTAALAGILGLMSYLNVGASLETAASLSLLLVSLSGACLILSAVGATGAAAFVGIGALATLIAAVGGIMAGLGALNAYFPQMEEFLNTGLVLLEKIGYGLGAFSGNIIGGFLAGTTAGLPEIGQNLSDFMTSAKPFFDNVKDIDANAMTGVEAMTHAILCLSGADILNSLTSWFTGGSSLTTFGEQLKDFGGYFKDYADEVSGIENMDVVAASANAAKTLAEFATAIPNSGGVLAKLAGENSMSVFAKELKSFGPAFAAYAQSVDGIEMDTVTASAAAAKSLAEFASAIPNSGGFLADLVGENSMSAFAKELKAFGPAFANYAQSIDGIEMDTVTASAAAAKSLAAFASAIPNSGGLLAAITGENSISAFAAELEVFGPAFANYAEAIAGIEPDTVTASASAAKSLAALAKDLPNSGGLAGFFSGNNDIDNFGQQLAAFGGSFKNYYDSISGISDTEKLTAATSGLQALINVAKGVGDGSGLKNFGNFLKGLAETRLDDFLNAFKGAESDVKKAGESLGKNLETGIRSGTANMKKAGQDAAQGFINGIKSKLSGVSSAGTSLGNTATQAARKALDSHSPSRVFEDIGGDTDAGLALGIKNNAGAVKDAVTGVVDTAKEAAGELTTADIDKWIGKVTTAEKKETTVAKTTASAAKSSAKAKEEAAKSAYETFLEYIEEERFYNRISTEEQLEQYRKVLETYQLSAEERKKACREIYTLEQQLQNESYQRSMDWIEQEKYYSRMSLADELAAYLRVQSRYEKGTEERKKMDKEVYRLQKEIADAQKQYIADVQAVQEEASQRRLDLEQEYADKVRSINEQLARDIEAANNEYESALKSREDSLYRSYGLFDAVAERKDISGEQLMANLEDQVKEFGEWQDALDSLSARGLSEELIDELAKMGPSAISEIKALSSMSDSELEKYASLWSIKHAQAREQAVEELEDLRAETWNKIADLRTESARELDEYRDMWSRQMAELNQNTNQKLEQLKQEFSETVGLIKKDTESELKEMTDTANTILRQAGWDETGKQIVNGLTCGVEEQKPSFIQALTDLAMSGVKAVKDTLDINSPSRVFGELGSYSGLGFVNALSNYADRSYDAGQKVADYARDGLANSIKSVADVVANGIDTEPTIRPIIDLTNVAKGAEDLDGLLYTRKSFELAGKAGIGLTASSDSKLNVTVENTDVVRELKELRGDMSMLADTIGRLKLVLDTGTLVGELAEPMDSALGRRIAFKGRGN